MSRRLRDVDPEWTAANSFSMTFTHLEWSYLVEALIEWTEHENDPLERIEVLQLIAAIAAQGVATSS